MALLSDLSSSGMARAGCLGLTKKVHNKLMFNTKNFIPGPAAKYAAAHRQSAGKKAPQLKPAKLKSRYSVMFFVFHL